jgi:PST family polysaccharide transporter
MGSLITVMLAVLVIGILKPGNQDEQILVGIIAAGMVFQAFDVCDLWFQAQTSAQYTVYAKSPAFLIASALKVWLILSHASLSAFVWVALIEVVMGVVGSLLIFWRNVMPITTWQLHLATCRKLLSTSWPLMLSGLAIMIYVKIDLVMLTQMQGATATGLYAAAVRISEVWYFIPMAIIASVTPTIVATKHEDEQRYYHRLERLFTLMARLALALALPISLLAYPLITLLFGSAYSAAAPILAIHIWSAVFVFLGVAQSPWDIAEDLTKLALYRTLGGAVINIALNLILIPSLAATGAAIATAISYACSGWILNLCYRQSRPIFLMQTRALIPFGDRLFRRVIRG